MPEPSTKSASTPSNSVRHHQSAMEFARFRLGSIVKAATAWTLTAPAYNGRRRHRLQTT